MKHISFVVILDTESNQINEETQKWADSMCNICYPNNLCLIY